MVVGILSRLECGAAPLCVLTPAVGAGVKVGPPGTAKTAPLFVK